MPIIDPDVYKSIFKLSKGRIGWELAINENPIVIDPPQILL